MKNDCLELHPEFEFTVRVYTLNKGSKDFHSWYKTVFLTDNPRSNDFDFSVTKDSDGEDVLEVMQHNPLFNIDALESIFESDRSAPIEERVNLSS